MRVDEHGWTVSLRRRVALIVLALVASAGAVGLHAPGAQAATNVHVHAVNVTSTSLAVAWNSSIVVAGSISLAPSCVAAGTVSATSAGEVTPTDGYVHLSATVTGLTANTTYYVKIYGSDGSVDTNLGACYSFTTLPSVAGTPPTGVVTGTVHYPFPTCSAPSVGVLVEVTVTNAGITSGPLGTTTTSSGSFGVDLSAARAQNGSPMTLVAGTSSINVAVDASSDIILATSITYAGPTTTVPTICLVGMPTGGATPTSTVIQPVTVSPTATLFVTSTPISTFTPIPSVTPTMTPATTGPVIGTATLPPLPGPPTQAATATSTSTSTATVTPTATPTATVTPVGVPLKAWTRIKYKVVHPNGPERIEVHTVAGASVTMTAAYPDKRSSFYANGKANAHGLWVAQWSVVALQRGRVDVRLTVKHGHEKLQLFRHFDLR